MMWDPSMPPPSLPKLPDFILQPPRPHTESISHTPLGSQSARQEHGTDDTDHRKDHLGETAHQCGCSAFAISTREKQRSNGLSLAESLIRGCDHPLGHGT